MGRVEHGYTAGQVFPHHTCARYIPTRPVNDTVPYKTRDIILTCGILIIKTTTAITMLYFKKIGGGDYHEMAAATHTCYMKKNTTKKNGGEGWWVPLLL